MLIMETESMNFVEKNKSK